MANGEDERLEVLTRYYPKLLTFLRQLGLGDAARDVAQDVFVRVLKSKDDYRGEAKWNYLEQIARRLAYNFRRDQGAAKRSGTEVSESVLVDLPSKDPGPADILRRDETRRLIRGALDRLDPRQRFCIEYFYVDDLSIKEIGDLLHVSISAVKSRLHAGRNRLKELLDDGLEGLPEIPEGPGEE